MMAGSPLNEHGRRPRAYRSPVGGFRPLAAFSLIELMIAIVILGFGMVMAATMFPVGWSRARDLSEHTVEQSLTDSVHATLHSIMQVSGPDYRCAGFAGDLIFTGRPEDAHLPNTIRCYSDTRVHALHLQNIRVEDPAFVPEEPWQLEWMDDTFLEDLDIVPTGGIQSYRDRSYFTPRIRFHERLYPPMKARSDPDLSVADATWDDTLDSRRHCWAVFHRLRELVGPDSTTSSTTPSHEEQAQRAIVNQRVFDVYFVTLRRPRTTPRFAVQDPNSAPNPIDRTFKAAAPADLGPQDDLALPIPWRMQIEFDPATVVLGDDSDNNPDDPTHLLTYVPTEAKVHLRPTSSYALDIFQDGTLLIDEVSGQIYRVTKQRIPASLPGGQTIAVLTLDREIVIEDLDDGDTAGDGSLLDDEFLRAVWVFPPPVLPRSDGDDPVFEGRSPVVGIEVRTVSISPNP